MTSSSSVNAIAFYCEEYPPALHGGIGAFCKDLAEGLAMLGIRVLVFGVYQPHRISLNSIERKTINGVDVIRVPERRYSKYHTLNQILRRRAIRNLARSLAQEEGFELLEAQESSGFFPLGNEQEYSLITRLHGGVRYFARELGRQPPRLSAYLEKRQLLSSARIIGCSEYVARKTFEHLGCEKHYHVIHNSVSDQFLVPYGETREKIILFTGSVFPRKGVTQLCAATGSIFARFPDYRLVIAGKNYHQVEGIDYEQYARRFIADEHQSKVTFTGALHRERQLLPLLRSAAVCVFPSHAEAFALAPLEAMALGKPVIYTKFGSGPEAIADGVSGILIDPNDPSDIGRAVCLVLADALLAERLGQNANETIRTRFNYQGWILENLNFYSATLDQVRRDER
jgi:glycosyltransferase involved in cell wall biosynthesis